MNTCEKDECSFCGEIKVVQRQYLHAKNTEHIDTNKHTPFTITYFCDECGLRELLANKK